MLLYRSLVAALLAFPAISLAQSPPPAGVPGALLPPVNSTAMRNERLLFDTPATVTVIPGEELDQRMTRNLEDVVRYTPGVSVNRQTTGTDPFKSLGGFTVRGVSGNRVLTLQDGFRTLERITDNTRDVLDPWNLKRIEIVRGPGSLLYGSDALGGVVNFITRDPADYIKPGETWGAEFQGSFSSLDASFQERGTIAGRSGNFSAMFAYQRRDANEPRLDLSRSPNGIWNCTRSPQAIPCNQLDPLTIASNNYFARVVWDLTPKMRVRLTTEHMDRATDVNQRYDLGPATGGNTNLNYDRRQGITRSLFSADFEYRPDLGWLDGVQMKLGYSPQSLARTGLRLRRLANGQRQTVADSLDYAENLLQGELQFRSSFALFGTEHKLTYGLAGSTTATDYSRQDITTNLTTRVTTVTRAGGFNFANADTSRLDGFVQNEITLLDSRLTLVPGLRLSSTSITPRPDSDYKPVKGAEPKTMTRTNLSFGLGAIYRIWGPASVYANYGEGFKTPTAEQLYTSLPGTTFNLVPNASLRPEKARSYEAGLRFQFQNAYASIGFFRAEYNDFIQQFVMIPNSIDITFQNLSEVTVQGIEFAGAWRFLPNWLLEGSASFQEGRQRETPTSPVTPFDGARPLILVIGITYENPEWRTRVTLNGTFAEAVTKASNQQRYLPGGYEVFDLLMSWRPFQNIELNGGILNILNRRYMPLPPGGTIYNQSQFTANDVKSVNPIELQIAPGTTFRVGTRVTF